MSSQNSRSIPELFSDAVGQLAKLVGNEFELARAELSEKANVAISCYPNAGLPNPLSETGFDLGPQDMARYLADFARGGLINIAGGCCGNTPEHIGAIAKALEGQPPRKWGTMRTVDSYDSQNASVSVADAEATR